MREVENRTYNLDSSASVGQLIFQHANLGLDKFSISYLGSLQTLTKGQGTHTAQEAIIKNSTSRVSEHQHIVQDVRSYPVLYTV